MSVPGSESLGRTTDSMSTSDKVFVNGKKSPVPVLQLCAMLSE